MSTNDIPVTTIYQQSLSTPPFTLDATLVDDATALVDDPTALSGGQLTIIEGLQSKVEAPPTSSKIAIYH